MKKILTIVSILAFMFVFVACENNTTTEATTTEATSETTTEATTITTTEATTQTTTEATTTASDTDPVFTGVANIYLDEGSALDLSSITVNDLEDGDLTDEIDVDLGSLDLDVAGEYTITLTVTDTDGNVVTETLTVYVEEVLTEADLAQIALDKVSLNYSDGDEEIEFPRYDADTGTWYYWKSTNTHVINSSGFIIPPHVGAGPVDVTITCTARNGSANLTKDFVVTVQPNPELTVSSTKYLDFVNISEEYTVTDKEDVRIFFMDRGSVPYIDIQTFIEMADGAIESSELTYTTLGPDQLEISYTVEYTDDDGVTPIYYDYTALVDFTENTITFNDYDFMSNYQGGISSSLNLAVDFIGYTEVLGGEFVIPLGEYNFDLVIEEDGEDTFYLVPFSIANLLFLGETYYNAYYNGDMIYGGDSYDLMDGDNEEKVALMQTSSFNTRSIPDDVKWSTYNFLALSFDYFYGLKDFKGIDTYYDTLDNKVQGYLEDSDGELYEEMLDFAFDQDEMHTRHSFTGFYEPPMVIGISYSQLGSNYKAYYEGLDIVEAQAIDTFGSTNFPEYTLIEGDTIAIVHITGFGFDTPDTFKATLDSLPATVTDVVVDVAYNGGGIGGAAWGVLAYMTDQSFFYHGMNPASGSAYSYEMLTNVAPYDFNFYVLTSSVSFSAANMFPSMAKEAGVPILGTQSSGGTCSLTLLITPDGSGITMSSNSGIAGRSGNEVDGYTYYLIEAGIPVDYAVPNVYSLSLIAGKVAEARADVYED